MSAPVLPSCATDDEFHRIDGALPIPTPEIVAAGELWARFLDGFGRVQDDALAHRCLAWGLLHRYANL